MIEKEKNSISVSIDKRFIEAMELFNLQKWYLAHDMFEELWHETHGPERIVLQGILQIAVAHVHLDNGNFNGATILYGEGLGRLKKEGMPDLGLNMDKLINCLEIRLKVLQQNDNLEPLDVPILTKKG